MKRNDRHLVMRFRRLITLYLLRRKCLFKMFFAVYFVTFCVILPLICRDWPHSFYMRLWYSHEELVSMAMESNTERYKMATQYLMELHPKNTVLEYKIKYNGGRIDLAVGVITVMRSFPQHEVNYLTQVMAQVDRLFRIDKDFSHKTLFMCNTHAGPGRHLEALKLAQYFPLVTRFVNGSASHVILDHFEKEKQDYSFCLKQALHYNATFILLIEDDALPHPDMFGALRYVLDHKIERGWYSGVHLENHVRWAYLKMFYPDKWQGYARDLEMFFELIALGILGGWTSLSVCLLCLPQRKWNYSAFTQILVFILGMCYVMLCVVVIGRQYLLELRRVSYGLYRLRTAPSCCTPAVLYPSSVVPDLITHLDHTVCSKEVPSDLAIDAFAVDHNLQRYIIEPNLVKHIGYISTLKGPSQRPELFI